MRILTAAAVIGLALAGSATAQTRTTSFTLQNTAMTPTEAVIIDGASWRCGEDNVCVATGRVAEQPATRACRRVVARVGALASFTWQGRALTADQLATCNTAAT